MVEIQKLQKTKLYKEDTYDIIQPYDTTTEIFNKERFDVEVIRKNGKKLVIIRNKATED